jgi:lipopolysaccharide export system protein LptA
MPRRASAIVLALAAVASGAGAFAAQSPTAPRPTSPPPDLRLRGPIKITAERAELERQEYALYRGRVKLVSADMTLSGDRLELRQPAKGQFEARLTGSPARLDHPGDAKGPPVSASASQIVYDTRAATVELTGDVQLARGTDQLSGSQVSYNLAARRISATGVGAGQVQITITPPEPQPDAQAPAATPPATPAPATKKKKRSRKK